MPRSVHDNNARRRLCGRAKSVAMSTYRAKINWSLGDGHFERGQYSRGHSWDFDGGVRVPASASPHNVPTPFAVEAAVDPEEAFVAAL
jgi:hypothetical protein